MVIEVSKKFYAAACKYGTEEYKDLQLGFWRDFHIYPGKPLTVTYNVTTAPGVETPLTFSKTRL